MKIGGTEINDIKIGNTPIKKVYKGTDLNWVSDANARAFISVANITDAIQKSAINQFVLDLKAINSIQSNFVNFTTPTNSVIKALYPFIGGSASTHKFNLINPLDTDEAFRLTFNGGITHDSLGIKGDGTSGYFDTHFNPSVKLSVNDIFLGFYSLEYPLVNTRYAISCMQSSTQKILFLGNTAANEGQGHLYNSTVGQGQIVSNPYKWNKRAKLQWVNKYNSNYNIGIGGVKHTENTNTGGTQPNRTLKGFCLYNAGVISGWETRQCGLMVIGSGLSDASISALSTACDNFHKNLVRYPYETNFIFDGDSMTYGLREGCTLAYPTQLLSKYSVPIMNEGSNIGVSGQTLLQMESDASTQIDTTFNSLKDYNIVLIWGGVNDLGLDLAVTAEEVYGRLKTYCQHRKSAGFKVYALTMLPQSVSTYSSRVTYEADRQIFNNLVRTDLISSGFADGIIDIASDSRIGLSGCENDTTYFLVDKIHMNNAGYGVVADIAYEAIRGIYEL
jgi:lysophospholipase L1-like esterase